MKILFLGDIHKVIFSKTKLSILYRKVFVINRKNFLQICLVMCNVKQKYLAFFKSLSLSPNKHCDF